MIMKYIYDWYIKWHEKKYHYRIPNKDGIPFQNCCYVKREYDDGKIYHAPFDAIVQIIINLKGYYINENKHPRLQKICDFIWNSIDDNILEKLRLYWCRKNHLMFYSTKEDFRYFLPKLKNNPEVLEANDLLYYIKFSRWFTKEEIDSIGFEKVTPKKVGKLKRIWYNLTLTAY